MTRIKSAVVTFPLWQIVSDKWAKIEFSLSYSGHVVVVLEHSPNQHGQFTGLRFNINEWYELRSHFETISAYIRASENGGSWKDMARVNHHYYQQKQDHLDFYHQRVRFPAVKGENIFVTLTSRDKSNQDGCQVDVRKCLPPKIGRPTDDLVYCRNGLTLVGGAFDYLARFICPKIATAIMMYADAEYYMEDIYGEGDESEGDKKS